MQTLIAPTDFSKSSLNAVNYAADMAVALKANLLVLHAIEIPVSRSAKINEPDAAEIEAQEKLNILQQDLLKRTNKKIEVQTQYVIGLIEGEIIKICTYKNPLAIVMATRGGCMQEHLFMESITVYLSKNLKHPVLVVPPDTAYKPINKILLATDLENIYQIPISKIENIVRTFKAELDIVHIYNKEDKSEITIKKMTELVNLLHQTDPHFYFIYNKDVYNGIISFAKKNRTDIILIFPKKHQFFHKSQSKQLVFNAPLAVMTLQ